MQSWLCSEQTKLGVRVFNAPPFVSIVWWRAKGIHWEQRVKSSKPLCPWWLD